MEGVGAAVGKVRSKAVAAHIFHLVLIGQRWHGALWILLGELFPEKDEVCEAAADGELGTLERLEVGLTKRVSTDGQGSRQNTNLGGDEIRDICILGAWQLLLRRADEGLKTTFAEVFGHG